MAQATKRKKRNRWLFFLAAVLLLAAGLIIAPGTPPFERFVLRKVKTYIQNEYGLSLDVRRLDLRVLGLSASVRGLEIKPLQESVGAFRSFSAKEITAGIALSSIFSGKPHLRNLKILAPRLELSGPEKTGGQAQAKSGAEKATTTKPVSLRIDRLGMKDGEISFKEKNFPIEAFLSGVAADLHYEKKKGEHLGFFQVREGGISLKNNRIPLREASLRLRFNDKTLTLDKLILRTPLSGIEVAGHVADYLANPSYSFDVLGSVVIEEFPLPNAKLQVRGKAGLTARIESRSGRPVYSGEITGKDLAVSGVPAGNFSIAFAGSDKDVIISQAVLQFPAGTLEGGGKVEFSGEPEYSLNLRCHELNLSKITEGFPALPVRIRSKLAGSMEAHGRGVEIKNLTASADLSISPLEVFQPVSPEKELPVRGNLRLRMADGILTLDRGSLNVGGIDFSAQGRFDQAGRISAKLAVSVPDAGASARFLASLAGPGTLPPQAEDILRTLKGRLVLDGTIGGTFQSPAGSLDLDVRDLGVKGFQVRSIKASLKATPERLDLLNLRAETDNGAVEAKGTASLDIGRKIFGRNILFNVRIDDFGIAPFAAHLPQNIKMDRTKISGAIDVKGGISALSIDFRLEAAPLFADFGEGSKFSVAGRSAGRRVVIDSMRVDGKGIALTASLNVDLSSRIFAASLHGDGINLTSFKSFLPPALSVEGIFGLGVEGKGTFEKPEFTMKISGKNVRVAGIDVPAPVFSADSDGRRAKANLDLPGLNVYLESDLLLDKPYRITGKAILPVLPLLRLAGKLKLSDTDLSQSGTVEAAFSFPILKPDDFSADATFSGLDLGALAKMSPQAAKFPLSGQVSGKIHIHGDPSKPAGMEMEGEVGKLALASSGLSLENKNPVRFRFKDDIFFLDELRMEGNDAALDLSGQAGPLHGALGVKARFSADLDLAAIGPFLPDGVPGGRAKLDIAADGPLRKPVVSGTGEIKNGFLQLRIFPLRITDVEGRILIQDSRMTFSGFKGRANNGFFNLDGEIFNIAPPALPSAKLKTSVKNFELDYPEGFLTASDADLAFQGDGKDWLISGEVKLRSGYFKEDVYPGAEMLGFSKFRSMTGQEGLPAIFRNVRLDIHASATEPFLIKNNLADMELTGDLTVQGNLAVPLLSGRIQNVHSGEIIFGDRSYAVETARINFLGKEVREPELDIVAHTKLTHDLEELDVRLRISGPMTKLTYDLTSFPPRSREELSLLLLTGKSLDQIRGSALNTLSSQMILYFASPLASPITQSLKKLLKAEDVMIEPLNIASEADPGARFTFKKRVSDKAAVTYSLDISNSQRQTWLLDYNLIRGFSLRAFSKDTGNYGASFSHSFSLGFPPSPAAKERVEEQRLTVQNAVLAGDLQFPEKILRKEIRSLRAGERFNFAELQSAAAGLLRFYRKNGFAGATVTPDVDAKNGRDAAVTFRIAAGRKARFFFLGDSLPSGVRKKALNAWDGKLPEATNLREAAGIILQSLRWNGRFKAEVKTEKKTGPEGDEFIFQVKKGGGYRLRNLIVEGNDKLATPLILKAVKDFPGAKKKSLWNILLNTQPALLSVKKTYEDAGFLTPKIEAPLVRENAAERSLDVILRVREGRQSFVAGVSFKGNTVFDDKTLMHGLRLLTGKAYAPALALDDRNGLLNAYRTRGFQDAEVAVQVFSAEDEKVSILYEIREGDAHAISGIEIAGNYRTRESFIRRETGLAGGDIVNLETLANAQKKLYDTGIFRSVTMETVPAAGTAGSRRLVVRVEETPRFSMIYGLRYNSEEKFEGSGEIHLNNLFGAGGNSLFSYRQNKRQKDLRFSLREPYIFGLRLNSLYSFYYTEDVRESFVTKEIGFSVQQETRLPLGFNLSLLYRLNRIHTSSSEFTGPFSFDFSLLLSETMLSLVRDSRDDKMDPRRGSFFSLNMTYAPSFLGSELTYIRGFAQASFYKTFPPGIVWASSYRIGLADAFDQVLISSRRFFAGGGNSIRGFKLDRVGPIDPYLDSAEGGDAVLIMNQELRFPVFGRFRGAVFYDTGNVYARVRDVRLSDLRHGLGLGVRFESPVGLIRLDYGFNLSPRAGESRGALYLSVGQAF